MFFVLFCFNASLPKCWAFRQEWLYSGSFLAWLLAPFFSSSRFCFFGFSSSHLILHLFSLILFLYLLVPSSSLSKPVFPCVYFTLGYERDTSANFPSNDQHCIHSPPLNVSVRHSVKQFINQSMVIRWYFSIFDEQMLDPVCTVIAKLKIYLSMTGIQVVTLLDKL